MDETCEDLKRLTALSNCLLKPSCFVERLESEGIYTRLARIAAGVKHNTEGPAVIYADGDRYWYALGKRHRDNGPAFVTVGSETSWYRRGLLHRTDGPATVKPHSEMWCENGLRHRIGGPAIVDHFWQITEWWEFGSRVAKNKN